MCYICMNNNKITINNKKISYFFVIYRINAKFAV